MKPPASAPTSYQAIYDTVRRIPRGKVCSYGQVARLAGLPGQARLVGYALHALRLDGTHQDVPWWRVISVRRSISNRYEPALQRALLEAEGITFDAHERVDAEDVFWDGA
jgi:methylated-DNA-protein-cysteine methyltransferase-like protein